MIKHEFCCESRMLHNDVGHYVFLMHQSNKIISMNPWAVMNYLKGTDVINYINIMFAQCELFGLFGVRFIGTIRIDRSGRGSNIECINNYSHPFARLGVRLEQFDARTSNCQDIILIVRLKHSRSEPVSLTFRSSMSPAHDLQHTRDENRLEIVVFYLLYFDSEFK